MINTTQKITLPSNVLLFAITLVFLIVFCLFFTIYLQECQIVELRDALKELQVEVETVKRDTTGLKEIQTSFQSCEKLNIDFFKKKISK